MAKLIPNTTYKLNGVKINEKIIPDDKVWTSNAKAVAAGFSGGMLYKKNRRLCGDTGKVKWVTIHNTNDLQNVEDDGEQYTRATYNENMGSVRVHFYVDELGAWQNLKAGTGMSCNDPEGSAEVGWHAGDGSVPDGGNMTGLSIEIIMDGVSESDEIAKDNGARIAAWLLRKHGLTVDELVTHTYWVNKACDNILSTRDHQCTTPVSGQKWCPRYIFGNSDQASAYSNWLKFKALVKKYYDEEDKADETDQTSSSSAKQEFSAGDLVKLSSDAVYYTGQSIPEWVKRQCWYISEVSGDRAVINKNESGINSICSPVNTKYLTVVRDFKPADDGTFEPYLVKLTSNSVPIYNGAGTNYQHVGEITDRGVYTIVSESVGRGAAKWGKLKSGAGWIPLDLANKL